MGKRVAFQDGNLHSKEFYNSNGSSHNDAIHDCLEVGEKMVYFERKSALDEYKIGDHILSHERNIAQIVKEYHDNHTKKDKFFDNIKKFQKFYNIIHLHGNNYRELNKDGFPINIEVT